MFVSIRNIIRQYFSQLLVSLRGPGSAEQAQFLSDVRSNGGKREASARVGHAREKE